MIRILGDDQPAAPSVTRRDASHLPDPRRDRWCSPSSSRYGPTIRSALRVRLRLHPTVDGFYIGRLGRLLPRLFAILWSGAPARLGLVPGFVDGRLRRP